VFLFDKSTTWTDSRVRNVIHVYLCCTLRAHGDHAFYLFMAVWTDCYCIPFIDKNSFKCIEFVAAHLPTAHVAIDFIGQSVVSHCYSKLGLQKRAAEAALDQVCLMDVPDLVENISIVIDFNLIVDFVQIFIGRIGALIIEIDNDNIINVASGDSCCGFCGLFFFGVPPFLL